MLDEILSTEECLMLFALLELNDVGFDASSDGLDLFDMHLLFRTLLCTGARHDGAPRIVRAPQGPRAVICLNLRS